MSQDVSDEAIPRHELIATALQLGIARPDTLSTEALTDAIKAASESPEPEPSSPGGWFAVARHLVATVVEQGLNLPTAARMIRSVGTAATPVPRQRPPLPTVTLAQIYLAQGHRERARTTLGQVLVRQPENHKAKQILEELERAEGADLPSASPATTERAAGSARGTEALVVLHGPSGVRVCWELDGHAAEVLADHGVELVLRVFEPSPLGVVVRERRWSVAIPAGTRGVDAPPGAEVRASLVDPHGGPLVVGSVFDTSGELLCSELGRSPCRFEAAARSAARALALRSAD